MELSPRFYLVSWVWHMKVYIAFLQKKRNKALQKAIIAMDSKADIQYNRLMHFKNSMLMYSIYNADILEKLINL